jgi:hypothetical protein
VIEMSVDRWLKGNTHTHTNYSDGDSPPEVVVDWYGERDYDFLFLTDHNVLIPDDHLARLQRRGLPVWQGEEITMAAVHVNGLGMKELVLHEQPVKSVFESEVRASRVERIRWAVEQVRAQDGVATVNHPNYLWALTIDDLIAAGDFGLLEVANGHNLVGNEGDADHPSTEWLWDRLLGEGRPIWGVASDDAHHFASWGEDRSNPGRGWLRVDAASPALEDCLAALRDGRFYSSSGLELAEYMASPKEIVIGVTDVTATFELIGMDGRVLGVTEGRSAHFDLHDIESPYARVRGVDAEGRRFWTQPVFL